MSSAEIFTQSAKCWRKKKKKFPVFISALLYWGKKSLDSLAFLLKKKKKKGLVAAVLQWVFEMQVSSLKQFKQIN